MAHCALPITVQLEGVWIPFLLLNQQHQNAKGRKDR